MTAHQFASYLYINYIRLTKRTELYQPTYNPNDLPLLRPRDYQRSTKDRLDFITNSLNMKTIGSYLDIGSQLGYMVASIADKYEILSYGLDHDISAVRYANSVASLNQIKNATFMNMALTPETAKKLPTYSLISFLNVFHHIAWHQGFAAAKSVTRTLMSKCDYFIFETGQSTEQNMPWAKSLKAMGKDPNKWIINFLNKSGVTIIDSKPTATHLSSNKRTIYITQKV